MLDQVHQQFITVVREGRGARLKETPEMFSGLFWNGEQAVTLGLADHFGNLDYVAREVVKAEEVIDYTPRENVAERLVKRFAHAHLPTEHGDFEIYAYDNVVDDMTHVALVRGDIGDGKDVGARL